MNYLRKFNESQDDIEILEISGNEYSDLHKSAFRNLSDDILKKLNVVSGWYPDWKFTINSYGCTFMIEDDPELLPKRIVISECPDEWYLIKAVGFLNNFRHIPKYYKCDQGEQLFLMVLSLLKM
jgi:hypothetical protein